jgi:hypothetical protein
MHVLRFLLLVALTLGSVLPHCAAAAPATQGSSHHAGMAHREKQPSKAHVSDACIGCATPVRLALPAPAPAVAPSPDYAAILRTLTTRTAALDPPPPRLAA